MKAMDPGASKEKSNQEVLDLDVFLGPTIMLGMGVKLEK